MMKEEGREAPPRDEGSDEGGGVIDRECVLIPEGRYELRFVSYETGRYFGRAKVIAHFAIIEPEDYAGLPVERFYNAERLEGPPGRYGEFHPPRRGDLTRELRRLVGREGTPDRDSFRSLKGKRIIGEVATVSTDYRKEALPKDEQYSRIKRLVEVLPDDEQR